jgi:hypothetical protein
VKLYRGRSGTQWTIDARGVRQSRNGQQGFYPLTLDWGEGLNGLGAYEDGQGSLWLTDSSGVYRLRDGRVSRYTERDGLPPRTTLRPHCQDGDGGIWFSLGGLFNDGNGVARFKDGRFTIYGNDAGLPVTSYLQIVADREGSTWIASANGLFRLKRNPITVYSTAEGLPHNEVYPLLQTRDGRIAVGTTHGLSLIADGAVVRHPLSDFTEVVQSLWEDRGGRLWIGTLASLYRYGHGKIEDLTPPAVKGAPVWAIREDSTGAVWVGTSRGLVKLEGDRVAEHHTTHDGLPDDDVKVIHESTAAPGQRVLWIGTSGGLARLVNGRFTAFTADGSVLRQRDIAFTHVLPVMRCPGERSFPDAHRTAWHNRSDNGPSEPRVAGSSPAGRAKSMRDLAAARQRRSPLDFSTISERGCAPSSTLLITGYGVTQTVTTRLRQSYQRHNVIAPSIDSRWIPLRRPTSRIPSPWDEGSRT